MKGWVLAFLVGACGTPTPVAIAPSPASMGAGTIDAAPDAPSRDVRAEATEVSMRGILVFEGGDDEKALALFREAIAIDPTYGEAHGNLGAVLANRKQFEEAVKALQLSVKYNPRNARAWLELGNVLLRNKESVKAFAALTKATELDPHSWQALDSLGVAARALDKHVEAATAWSQATTLDPTAGSSALRLAKFYDRWSYSEHALTVAKFGAARATDKWRAELLYMVGLFSDDSKEAVAGFSAALVLQPDFAFALAHRGLAFERLGDFKSARADFQRYLGGSNFHTVTIAVVSESLLRLQGRRSGAVVIPVAPTLDASALPPVPAFDAVEPSEGIHSVASLRGGREALFGKTVAVRGTIVWIYDCEIAMRRPGVSRRATKRKIANEPSLCTRPHLHLSDEKGRVDKAKPNSRRTLRVVEVPRAPRPDERKFMSKEELASWPVVPKLKVGQEVIVTGVFSQQSPQGFRDSEGLLVYQGIASPTSRAP